MKYSLIFFGIFISLLQISTAIAQPVILPSGNLVISFPSTTQPPFQIPTDGGLVVTIPFNNSGLSVSIPSSEGLSVSFPDQSRPPFQIENGAGLVVSIPGGSGLVVTIPTAGNNVISFPPNTGLVVSFPNQVRRPFQLPTGNGLILSLPELAPTTVNFPSDLGLVVSFPNAGNTKPPVRIAGKKTGIKVLIPAKKKRIGRPIN
ncbi:MAG: hypothetical protein HYV97_01475 [Bdellovibrio sp.]|nr:hypothetical protein [Bdellovibrio sp.]